MDTKKRIDSPSAKRIMTLDEYYEKVRVGERKFENAAQTLVRMILGKPNSYEKVTVAGETMFDFKVFRQGDKHPVQMHREINEMVSFFGDAAIGASAAENAFVLVGAPGNGKTFLIDYVCKCYRDFLCYPENRKYTIRFINLKELGGFGGIEELESQTYEDPMILLMNLIKDDDDPTKSQEKNKEHMGKLIGFTDEQIRELWKNHRSLGASSDYLMDRIREKTNGNVKEMFARFVKIQPIPYSETSGVITAKYTAKDKLTAVSSEIVGEESILKLLHISNPENPSLFDLRIGAIARTAGGGILFCDELFKHREDLLNIFLDIIQYRRINIHGFQWPIDGLIMATSNIGELERFEQNAPNSPMIDRCSRIYVEHNTNHLAEKELTSYCIGKEKRTTIAGEDLHEDPLLNFALSNGCIVTRYPQVDELTKEEIRKLAANEVAGDKSAEALAELVEKMNSNPEISKHWGQRGLGQRSKGRAIQTQCAFAGTHIGRCMIALDAFKALKKVIIYEIKDSKLREEYLQDIKKARKLYRAHVEQVMFDAYLEEPGAIRREVVKYINMVVGSGADDLGPDNMWSYTDPQTKKRTPLKIDPKFMESVEKKFGINTDEERKAHRNYFTTIFGRKVTQDPDYDFMDNEKLVTAVTRTRLESDIDSEGGLIAVLSNQTNAENREQRSKIMKAMRKKPKPGFCETCAIKTIEYYISKDDVS